MPLTDMWDINGRVESLPLTNMRNKSGWVESKVLCLIARTFFGDKKWKKQDFIL